MGSDATGKVSRMFGVYLEEAGVALRGTFIISPDGVLMNSDCNYLNMGRNIDELMRRFKANLYLAKKKDEGCPSKWKEEGDATLRPGPEMVGKVHEALRS
jgi:peroxiredoxin (alkyl hydroperoxide reductase subunit C)